MTSPVTAAPQTTSAVRTWKLDPAHTHIEFAAKHMMVSTVKGQFSKFDGVIVADEANPAHSSVEVTIDAASLSTRDERRDGHLHSPDFLDVQNYPHVTFKSRQVTFSDSSHFQVVGDLTIRGVSKEVVLNASYEGKQTTPWGTTVAGFTAETRIDRREWGLNWNAALETGGWLVGNEIRISIEAEANPA
ncbi:MAG: YceI family protein [Anaerolineae bacterium]|nr:YceI family protein [Anaerolineae bacterium]